jgi:uncharacterized membrane protein
MIKKIANGYGRLFSSTAKVVLLASLCLGLSFIIVYPLWKWAISSPSSYSWAVLALVCIGIVYLVVRSIKKNGALPFLHGAAKVLVVLGGLCGCVFFVLNGKRILALVCLAATFVLYGILAFGFKGTAPTPAKEEPVKAQPTKTPLEAEDFPDKNSLNAHSLDEPLHHETQNGEQ